jgi:hypothetical protein
MQLVCSASDTAFICNGMWIIGPAPASSLLDFLTFYRQLAPKWE